MKNINRDLTDLIGDPAAENFQPIPAIIGTAELSELLGIGAKQIGSLAGQGVLEKIGPNKFAARRSIAGYIANHRRGTSATLETARIRNASAQARKHELANAKAEGQLLDADAVRAEWSSILADVRAAMLAVPSRLPELDRALALKLDGEIRSALERLSNG